MSSTLKEKTFNLNPGIKEDDEDSWTKVVSRKHRRDKLHATTQESKIRAIQHYWNGFNKCGEERWYIELSNGVILSSHDKDYDFWMKRHYPNGN